MINHTIIIDEFYKAHQELYHQDHHKFYKHLLEHYFSEHDKAYGQHFYRNWFFTPFKENSEDYEELDGLVEEKDVQEVVDGSAMEFLCIFYSYGYPDHFFVCTSDPDPSNPTVYSTDHEVYFQEIENRGKLEEFLDRFMTEEEFLETVQGYLGEKIRK